MPDSRDNRGVIPPGGLPVQHQPAGSESQEDQNGRDTESAQVPVAVTWSKSGQEQDHGRNRDPLVEKEGPHRLVGMSKTSNAKAAATAASPAPG